MFINVTIFILILKKKTIFVTGKKIKEKFSKKKSKTSINSETKHKKPDFSYFMQPVCISDPKSKIENDKTWNKMMKFVYSNNILFNLFIKIKLEMIELKNKTWNKKIKFAYFTNILFDLFIKIN